MMVRDEDSCNIFCFALCVYKNFCGQKKHKKVVCCGLKKIVQKVSLQTTQKEKKNKTINKHASSLCEIGLKKKIIFSTEEEDRKKKKKNRRRRRRRRAMTTLTLTLTVCGRRRRRSVGGGGVPLLLPLLLSLLLLFLLPSHGDTGEIIVEDLTDPKNFDERRGDLRSTHQMFDENGYVVGTSSSFHGDGDDVTHIEDLQEIGRSVDDFVDDGGPAIPKHYVCNACQASARKLDADLSDEEFKRARGAKYGKKLEEMYYLDAIEKSCDDHAHWHLYHAHVYDSGYHYLAGPLLGNASKRGSKPFVRDFSKHRWPKRLRDYCQVLVNEFDEEVVYAKHYELQQEKLAWEEEKRKEEEEEAELEKTMTEEEYKLRRKKKRREEILHPHKRRKKRKSFDLAKKLCYQTDPPKCTFDTEFKKRAFLQLATHEEEEQAKKSQHLGWDEREGVVGGIRYERTDPEKAKKASETFSSSSSSSSSASSSAASAEKNKKKNKKKNKNERQHAETKDEL